MYCCFLPLLVALSGPIVAPALGQSDTLRQYHIPTATVQASRVEIVPAQTLRGEELERLSLLSIADALRYYSGVQIKDYGGVGGVKTVNVRSMGSQHVGVFYDGIQIGNAQNGTVDLGRFSLDNMEALSLYNGQKSEIFQSAKDFASASALYMVTRKPTFKSDKKSNLILKAKTGSFHLANSSLLWEQKLSERLSLSLNGEALYTSGKYKFRYQKMGGYDTTELRRNGDVRAVRGEGALFGKVKNGEWQTKLYLYSSERGYPGAAVKQDYGISLLNEDRQRDRNLFIQSLYRKSLTPYYSLKLQAKYANDYMNYIMPPESTLEPMDNHFWQQELYLTASNLLSLTSWWNLNLALDLQYNHLDADGTDMFNSGFVEPRRLTALAALATSLRFKRFSLQGSLLYTFVEDRSGRGRVVAPNREILTPTAIASYRPLEEVDLEIRAFYKKIFRMPTFNDLYYVQIGNRLLKPEWTTQYNIGLSYTLPFESSLWSTLMVEADGYFNQVIDKIIATPTSNQLVWTMVNLGYVEIRGADIGVTQELTIGHLNLSSKLSYSYQKAQDFTPEKERFYGHQIPYIPWHSGSAIVNGNWHSWNLNYSFIYTGERYMLGGNIAENYIQPWYTSDLSLTKEFSLKRASLKIRAELNNLFNQQYEVVKWYPMPGTNFKINITIEI